jgi:hypothetical protein
MAVFEISILIKMALTRTLKRHCEERFLRRSSPAQMGQDCFVAKNAPRNDESEGTEEPWRIALAVARAKPFDQSIA